MSLQEICRRDIRGFLRANIDAEHPNLSQQCHKKVKRPPRRSRNRINVVPMNMGMMILGQFGEDSDRGARGDGRRIEEAPENVDHQELHDLRRRRVEEEEEDMPGLRRRGRRARIVEEEEEEEEEEEDEEDEDDDDAPGMPEILRQMAAMQRRFMEIARRERGDDQQVDQEDQGIGEEIDEELEEDGAVGGGANNRETWKSQEEQNMSDGMLEKGCVEGASGSADGSVCSSSDEMDVDICESGNASCAIPISPSNGRQRCSSSTSISTSYTSGIGTCSSVEEPIEMDFIKELDDEEEELNSNLVLLSNGKTNGRNGKSLDRKDTDCISQNNGGASTSHGELSDSDSSYVSPFGDPPPYLLHSAPLSKNRIEMDTVEEDETNEPSEPRLSFSVCMRQKVEQLPIPLALKQFLLFYRS